MFRIFLKKKLFSGEKAKTPILRPSKQKNRRTYERFPIDQQHLTVLNDQDILMIRDISVKGFCSDVSDRAYERFAMNDIYEARMRTPSGVQSMAIKVAWKRERSVGFELHEPSKDVLLFFRNLVRPIQLAHSLSPVEAGFMRDQHAGRIWYHGEDVDLHIWTSEEDGISAWQLVADNKVVEWSTVNGVKTGQIKSRPKSDLGIYEPGEVYSDFDEKPNTETLNFASALIGALPIPEKLDLENALDDTGDASSVS